MCFTVGPLLRYSRQHRYFSVRAIEMQGLRRLDAARVRTWLGMVEGSSIWQASPRELEGRLEAQPAIARARVRRILPDRLVVTVKEREPRALLRHGARAFLVDRAGVVIDDAPLAGGDLPILTLPMAADASSERAFGAASTTADAGDAAGGLSTQTGSAQAVRAQWMPSSQDLRQAVQVARLLEAGLAGVAVSEIALEPGTRASGRPELVAFSSDGRLTLRLGWGGWREKLGAVRRVLDHAATQVRQEPSSGSAAGTGHGEPPAGLATSAEHRMELPEGIPVGLLAGTVDVRDPGAVVVRWARPGGRA